MSWDNVAIVRRLYDAVACRDSATVLAIYDPQVEWDHTHNEAVVGLMGGRAVYHGTKDFESGPASWRPRRRSPYP